MTEYFNIHKYDSGDIMIELKHESWQCMVLSEDAQDDLLNLLLLIKRNKDE